MRTLFVFDYKDYKENSTVGIRPSVRGIDQGEKHEDTIIREIREELGPDTALKANRENDHGSLTDESCARNLFEREGLKIKKLREEGVIS